MLVCNSPFPCPLPCAFISNSTYLVHFLFEYFPSAACLLIFTFLLIAKLNHLVDLATAMVLITREQAICMFYHQPYNKQKAEELLKAIENIQTEICYRDDPTKPFLLYKNSVFMDPINNHTYTNEIEASDVRQIDKREIVSPAQLISFLNITMLPSDPKNGEIYICRSLTMNDILSIVWKYSNILDDMNTQGLSKWCGARKLELMKATIKRKQDEFNRKISTRILYVVKDQYIESIIKDVVETLPRHQESIRNLKKNGHEVIGYIRKSTGEKDNSTRIRLLNQMSTNLKERSLVTKVFASASCDANQPLLARDLRKNTDMLSNITADGDMQGEKKDIFLLLIITIFHFDSLDLLAYIRTREKICIVVIDFAGLTTNSEDLEQFLR
ncbi:unnamed protein product [Mucor fragilis]